MNAMPGTSNTGISAHTANIAHDVVNSNSFRSGVYVEQHFHQRERPLCSPWAAHDGTVEHNLSQMVMKLTH